MFNLRVLSHQRKSIFPLTPEITLALRNSKRGGGQFWDYISQLSDQMGGWVRFIGNIEQEGTIRDIRYN